MSESHYDCPCMEKCPLHHAMQLIGGKWKVQILCAVCSAGAIRYNALRSKLDGVSNTVLSSALRELERDGAIVEDFKKFKKEKKVLFAKDIVKVKK